MVKNKYLDLKINLLSFQGAKLHLEVVLDHVVGIVVGVGVHLEVLKPFPVNSAWSKTFIWTPRSTLYEAWKLSYSLKWPWTILLALLLVWLVKNIYLDQTMSETYLRVL